MSRLAALLALGAAAAASDAPAHGVLLYAVGHRSIQDSWPLVASIQHWDPALPLLYVYSRGGDENVGIPPLGEHCRAVQAPDPIRKYAGFDAHPDHFDAIKAMVESRATTPRGIKAKIAVRLGFFDALAESTFGVTMLLDTDMVACRSLMPVFAAAGDADLAFVTVAKIMMDFTLKRDAETFRPYNVTVPPPAHPYANTGLLVYRRRSPAIQALFKRWRELYELTVTKHTGDQPTFWVATHEVRVETVVLANTAQCRTREQPAGCLRTREQDMPPPGNRAHGLPFPFNLRPDEDKRDCVLLHGHKVHAR